ncbi:MAG: CDP-alcohol phosphatidyltransferase family protein [Actinobacteria bacterium]|nr:CDP-alcohol phosphatidyltransferase family protein [Actinomycetota bacterium]
MLGADPVRRSVAFLIDPFAKALLKLGITANWVTLVGTVGVCVTALTTFPQGEFLLGTIVICLFAVFDLLDGTMARLSGATSKWGAYVDSVSDRLADGAMMGGVVLFFALSENDTSAFAALAALVLGQIVSYSRARAESLGLQARIGIGERAERTIIFLLGTLLAGLGFEIALSIAVWVLAVISAITVIQRAVTVYAQATLEKR